MASTPEFDRLLAAVLAGLFVVFVARCAFGTLLLALGRLPGTVGLVAHQWGQAITPRLVRRLTAGMLGVLSTGAIVSPVAAAKHAAPDRAHDNVAQMVIDRAVTVGPGHIVVSDSDCLWSLAQDQLGETASDSEIDAHWRRWYALNREAIGPNPDVIATGMTLTVPVVAK